MSKTVWVFDIDSTLADNTHRESLLKERCSVCLYAPVPFQEVTSCPNCGSSACSITQDSWDAFLDSDAVAKDIPIKKAIKVLDKLREFNSDICFITGRHRSRLESVTKHWLSTYANWNPDTEPLYMREADEEDMTASEYKARALDRLKAALSNEACNFVFFEDDPYVFNLYNKHGLVVRCPEAWDYIVPTGSYSSEPTRAKKYV